MEVGCPNDPVIQYSASAATTTTQDLGYGSGPLLHQCHEHEYRSQIDDAEVFGKFSECHVLIRQLMHTTMRRY